MQKAAAMEQLQLFKDCLTKETTLRQAFSCFGINKAAKRYEIFKEMDEDTVFACIMNWMIHQMPTEQTLRIRFKTENGVYQVKIKSHKRHLQINSLTLLTEDVKEFMLYDWKEKTTYDNLTSETVKEAIKGADTKNNNRKSEENSQKEWLDEPVKITDEDMELINDFLDV